VAQADQGFEELLGEENVETLRERFLAGAEVAYRDAVNLKEHGYGNRGIPTWLLIVLLAVGWNELMWLLGSPLLFYPFLFVLSLLALCFAMGVGQIPLFVLRQLMQRFGLPRLF